MFCYFEDLKNVFRSTNRKIEIIFFLFLIPIFKLFFSMLSLFRINSFIKLFIKRFFLPLNIIDLFSFDNFSDEAKTLFESVVCKG